MNDVDWNDIIFLLGIFAVIVLFSGTPGLMDAIISNINNCK